MKELDKFGEFFVKNTRDQMLENLEFIIQGKWEAPSLKRLHSTISEFTDEQKDFICTLVDHISVGVMHDLLFAFQESSDLENGIILQVDGKDLAQISDGLHGEIFTDEGWIKRFSKFEYNETNLLEES